MCNKLTTRVHLTLIGITYESMMIYLLAAPAEEVCTLLAGATLSVHTCARLLTILTSHNVSRRGILLLACVIAADVLH